MGKEQESTLRGSAVKQEKGGEISSPFLILPADFFKRLDLGEDAKKVLETVSKVYPVRIPEFYAQLMDREDPKCPIRAQAIPSLLELDDSGFYDPLDEGSSENPTFIKRYPGRAVFIASSECALYCRFCNRKRFVGRGFNPRIFWEDAFSIMERRKDLREIILSGGDPFTLSPEEIGYLLRRIRSIGSIKVLRISTRIPVADPDLISDDHFDVLKNFPTIWIVLHINHPKEITPQFLQVVRRFQLLGFPTVSQTVLLRGVNDCAKTLKTLFETLIQYGIKPYYLFQLDEVRGARHFKVRISHGKKIYAALRREISGLALPNYVLDLTGGAGKIPVTEIEDSKFSGKPLEIRRNGRIGTYSDDGYESQCSECGFCE